MSTLNSSKIQILFGLCIFLFIGHPINASPQNCSELTSIAIDLDEFAGIWWEVVREPSSINFCTEVNITVQSDGNVSIATTYSNTALYPWVNQTMTTDFIAQNLTVNDGYNISYVNPPTTTAYTMFKILATDYTNYALICGYTNATDNSTSFGLILARNRTISVDLLESYEAPASLLYSNFLNGTMALVTQDSTCYSSSIGLIALNPIIYMFLTYIIACLLNN